MDQDKRKVAVIGASGAIGGALVEHLARRDDVGTVHAFSRSRPAFSRTRVQPGFIDLEDEHSIEEAAKKASAGGQLDLIIVATGLLHGPDLGPEKSLRDLSAEKFSRIFSLNTTGPALVARHFLPIIRRDRPAVFAALSARVGSISENRLGGWYAYRASKAALNMIIRTASIEVARRNPQAVVVGLHPGTVDSKLSAPFQANVPAERLFTPDYAAARLLQVVESLTAKDSGKCFAYDGQEIAP